MKTSFVKLLILFFLTSSFITLQGQENMTLTFNTNLGSGTTITLPLQNSVDVTIDWGDGAEQSISTVGNHDHTYAANREYTVTISGTLTQFGNGSSGYNNVEKLVSCTSFGDLGTTSLKGAFYGASNLTTVPETIPSTIIHMHNMFHGATSFNQDISNWDVSSVVNMFMMFRHATSFNQDISSWDVSNVSITSGMFMGATSFNQDIGIWNVSSVWNMSSMLQGATSFNQDISTWNVSNVSYMDNLLYGVKLSTTNYNNLLTAWSQLILQEGVTFHAGTSNYSAGAPVDARQSIIDNFDWTITDGGMEGSTVYEILASTTPSGSGTVNGAENFIQQYEEGQAVTLTANANEGYTFLRWTENETSISTANPLTFTAEEERVLVANFEEPEPMYLSFNTNLDDGTTITLPLHGTVDVTIDWGDGSAPQSVNTAGNLTHTYTTDGEYTVTISGTLTQFGNASSGYNNAEKLVSCTSFGDLGTTSFHGAFSGAENLTTVPETIPPTITNLSRMFYFATSFNQNINTWDVSSVTDMSNMFHTATSFNKDLSAWNVSSVTNMANMFYDVKLSTVNYNNILLNWSQLTLQNGVEFHAGTSNYVEGAPADARQSIIDNFGWTITDGGMVGFILYEITAIAQPSDIGTVNGSEYYNQQYEEGQTVTLTADANEGYVFQGWTENETSFSTTNPLIFAAEEERVLMANFGEPEPMVLTFNTNLGSGTTVTLPLHASVNVTVDWGDGSAPQSVSTAGNLDHTYATEGEYTVTINGSLTQFGNGYSGYNNAEKLVSCTNFGNLGITSLKGAFYGALNLTIVPETIPSTIIHMHYMFHGATSFNQDISNWDLSNIVNMFRMFRNATLFNQNINTWDVSSVSIMSGMFWGATSFNQDISEWDVSSVWNMSSMFQGATSFNQDISTWDVSNVSYMDNLLNGVKLATINYNNLLSGWSQLALQDNVTFHAGTSNYSEGTPTDSRQKIIDNFGWTITDGVMVGSTFYEITASATPSGFGIVNGAENYSLQYEETEMVTLRANANEGYVFREWTESGISISKNNPLEFTAQEERVLVANFGEPEPMLLTFNTNLSSGTTITLPLHGTLDVTIDWGDGSTVQSISTAGNLDHTYTAEGEYTVTIGGTLTQFGNGSYGYGNAIKLVSCINFGNVGTTSLKGAFYGAENLIAVPETIPSTITDMEYMFHGAISFNQNINTWNMSQVTNMGHMFHGATAFNQDISEWDVGSTTNIKDLFHTATSFNQDLSTWDLSNVTNMSRMFQGASSFNQDISSWDVNSVTNMEHMFHEATAFNQDISTWDVSSVSNATSMFQGASSFNQDISSWDVNSITNMEHMFHEATAFNQDISTWDVSSVSNAASMFQGASSFNQDISSWDVNSITNMEHMFHEATAFNQDISTWDVSSVSNAASMFQGASSFNQDISSWDVSSVTNMGHMFHEATAFNQDISSWDVSSVWDMSNMFQGTTSFDQDISSWDISNVSYMGDFLNGVKLSTENYNNLLTSWSQLTLQNGVDFHGGISNYLEDVPANARQSIIDNFGWTITDGGMVGSTLYEITASANPLGFGIINGVENFSHHYYEGETVSLMANANEGYVFQEWTENGTRFSAANPLEFTVEEERVLVANFVEPEPMVLVFNTNLGSGTTVTLPLHASVDVTIDWGDGSTPQNVTIAGNLDHTYASEGEYIVTISGILTRFGNSSYGYNNAEKLVRCSNFGDLGTTSLKGAFYGAENLTTVPETIPPTIRNMNRMFQNATSFNQDISLWDVSNVSYMEDFLNGVNLSIVNYNNLLTKWSQLTLQNGVVFHAGTSNYSEGTAADARQSIIDNFGWIITDGGMVGSTLYEISASVNPSGFGTVNGAENVNQQYYEGETVKLTANANEGYAFREWTENGSSFSTATSLEFTAEEDRIIVAHFREAEPMILTFNTNLGIGTTVTLPLHETVKVAIDWGDDSAPQNVTTAGNLNHTYATEGEYTVTISGTLTQFGTGITSYDNAEKLISCTSFGDLGTTSLNGAFYGAENLTTVPETIPSTIRNTNSMFHNATSFNQNIGAWDVSSISIMSSMFQGASSFNQDISTWDVSSVSNMQGIFNGATTFNQNLSLWDVSEVRNMINMFHNAELSTQNYNNLLIGWSQLTLQTDRNFHAGTSSYSEGTAADARQSIIDNFGWTITDGGMVGSTLYEISASVNPSGFGTINGAENFSQQYGKNETVTLIANAKEGYTFLRWTENGTQFSTANPLEFSAEEDRVLEAHFREPEPMVISFNTNLSHGTTVTLPLHETVEVTIDWGDGSAPQSVSTAGNLDHTYTANGEYTVTINGILTQFGNGWDGYNNAQKLVSCLNFGDLGTTSFYGAFFGAENLTTVPETIPPTIRNMNSMFWNATSFNQNIGGWDMNNISNMGWMFMGATSFNQDISAWDVSNSTNMTNLFSGVKLSTVNYNNILLSWSQLTLQNGVVFHAGTSNYSEGTAAAARQSIIDNFAWIITDGGMVGSNLYVISASVNPTGFGTVNGTENVNQQYYEEETVKLTASANEGYLFQEWTENGSSSSTATSLEFTAEEDKVLVAHFREAEPMILTFNTNLGNGTTITLPLHETVDVTIDWGDDSAPQNVTTAGNLNYTYPAEGVYTITISGTLTQFGNGSHGYNNSKKLVSCTSFGELNTISFHGAFYGAENLTTVPETIPSTTTNMSRMFFLATSFNQDISTWDVSNVSYMFNMFSSVKLSTVNYNKILTSWSQLELQNDVNFHVGNSNYSEGAPADARQSIIDNFGWTITDGGMVGSTLYEITATAIPSGFGIVNGVDYLNQQYYEGENATLVAIPKTNYVFINWTENETVVSTDATYAFSVSEERSLMANFTLQSFTILASANPTEGGSVTGAGTYNYDDTATLIATPEIGFKFVNWTENETAVSTDATYAFSVSEERSLMANFTLQSFTILASANPTEGGSVTGAGTYNYDDTATLIATPEIGFKFVNWTENETVVSTDANYSFTVTEERSLVANFEATEPMVLTFNTNLGDSTTVTLPLYDSVNVAIDWGDDSTPQSVTTAGNVDHTYAAEGEYTVTISGILTQFGNSYSGYDNAEKLVSCTNFGDLGTTYFTGAFNGAENLTTVPETIPSTITDMRQMFQDATTFNQDISTWDVSNVNYMKHMFYNATSFNQDISAWDVSSVANMEGMFYGVKLSTVNYNNILTSWSQLTLQNGVEFHAGTSNYSEGAPADARQSIIDNFGWTITDGIMVGSTLYEITASTNPSGFGTVNGTENFSQQYGEGENVYLVASPQTGYEFVNWTENETEVSTYNSYSFTASQARNLIANFKDETAISEFNTNATVIVYPNPANDLITIKLDNYEINSNKAKIVLYDVSGKAYKIKRSTFSQNRITLDVSDKADGLYFIQMIIDSQKIETAKVRIVK